MKRLLAVFMAIVFAMVMSAPAFAFKDWVGTKPPSKSKVKQGPKTNYGYPEPKPGYPDSKAKVKQAPTQKKPPGKSLLEQGSR